MCGWNVFCLEYRDGVFVVVIGKFRQSVARMQFLYSSLKKCLNLLTDNVFSFAWMFLVRLSIPC